MPQNTKRNEKKDLPKYNLFGASNTSGLTFLSPYTVQGEKFGIADGFSAITVDGLNGKGEAGKENPINKLNIGAKLDEVGQSIMVTNRLVTAKRVVFSDIEDPTLSHVLYFDHRRSKPIGYFTEKNNGEINGKPSFTTTQKDASIPVVLKAKTISEDDLRGVVNTIITAFNEAPNLKMKNKEAFGAEIQKHNLMNMENVGQMAHFISIFDTYFEPTEENIKAIKSILPELKDDVTPPKMTAFKDGISKIYNMIELNGITVKNLKSATALNNLINGRSDEYLKKEGASRLLKEFKSYLDNQKDLRFSIQTEEEIIVGVDATGSIIVLENSNIPRKSGGDIYKTEISSLVAPFRANLTTLKKKYNDDGTQQHVPDDNAVIQAEQSLLAKVQELAVEFGVTKEIETVLGSMQSISGAIINKATNNKAGVAMAQANSLFSFIENALVKRVVMSSDLVKDNMLTKNGSRVRQQYHSNHRKSHPLERWDGVSAKDTNEILIVATLPTLTYPPKGKDEKGVANFKEAKSAVQSVFLDKKSGEVVAVDSQNDISFWGKSQAKVGKVLNAIMNLDPKDENLETKLKNFVNFGGKIGDKVTNFGLLALKREENAMSHTFGELFQEMRGIVYPGDTFDTSKLADLQKRIGELAQSTERNEKQLGLYVESVGRNINRNRLLTQSFYVAASNENSKKLVNFMGGNPSALANTDAYRVKTIKDTALVVDSAIHGIKTMLAGETANNLLATATKIGWNIISSQRLELINKGKDFTFIQTPSAIKDAEIARSSNYDGKTRSTTFASEVLDLIGSANTLDISEGLATNLAEYQENKPKYDYTSEMYSALEAEREKNAPVLDAIILDMSSLSSMGVEVQEIPDNTKSEIVEEVKEEEVANLSEEEREDITTSIEEKEMFKDLPIAEMDELNLAIEQHNEEEREGWGISEAAKKQAKEVTKTQKAPTLSLV